jgi:hypothetical protein
MGSYPARILHGIQSKNPARGKNITLSECYVVSWRYQLTRNVKIIFTGCKDLHTRAKGGKENCVGAPHRWVAVGKWSEVSFSEDLHVEAYHASDDEGCYHLKNFHGFLIGGWGKKLKAREETKGVGQEILMQRKGRRALMIILSCFPPKKRMDKR